MAARRCAPDYLVETRGVHVFSETYGWAPRAGASAVIDGKRVSFNAGGYRGRELALRRARDRTRVIVLGDSIAFGLDVSDDETFTYLLDARENGIEAGNLAVQGYGPGQELLVLAERGAAPRPGCGDPGVLSGQRLRGEPSCRCPSTMAERRSRGFSLIGDRLVLDDSNLRLSAWRRTRQWLGDYSHLFNRVAALDSRSGLQPAVRLARSQARSASRRGIHPAAQPGDRPPDGRRVP